MNLPFSPTFFRKMDIFQQLMEYEDEKSKKHLWEGEKAVLIWAASEHHQHLGSFIDSNHVKDALKYCAKEKFITESENHRMQPSARHILDSLPVHEFGDREENPDPKISRIKINRNGILAGRILTETSLLEETRQYQIWTSVWWIVLGAAALILLAQALNAVVDIKTIF